MQSSCRPGEVQLFGQHHEVAQSAQIHRPS
jgi:hypothetical protein